MDSKTSASQVAIWRRLLCAVALLWLAGCGPTTVQVEGQFPEPLMQQLPLAMGVWYGEDFRGHEFFDEAKGRGESDWLVQTGSAQIEMWDILLNGMFLRMTQMSEEPGPDKLNEAVDAILIPSVDELQYAIPTHTNVKVYEIWMRYRFKLVEQNGDPIAEWTMTAYGKTPTAFLQSDAAAVNLAAIVALRDAGANFATGFMKVPEVRAWLQQRGRIAPETGV